MGSPAFGVVVFPGSNCDHDAYYAIRHVLGSPVEFLWHKDHDLRSVDVIILPGGFSYGDYLRCGSIAKYSPIMKEVIRFANDGGYVIGICNGFQVLTEAGLLPGALLKNTSLRFVCKDVTLRIENNNTAFTNAYDTCDCIRIPIAHGEGNYFTDPDTLAGLEANQQIVFRYVNRDGIVSDESNPNGSLNNIAGIVNRRRNVLGMMPHPERRVEDVLGSDDGLGIFKSLVHTLEHVSPLA